MPPQETPQYMLPDFDPWKMKMDKIRDILIQHGVKPTGMISKQEMVDLFNLHIKPQAAELRAKHESIVPTEEGIIKVSRGTKGKGTIVDLYDGDNDDSDSRPTRKAVKTKRSTSKLRSHEE
ncbi:inner nuclear membrane protein enriched at telomere/subtelomere region, partial [Podila humilis]